MKNKDDELVDFNEDIEEKEVLNNQNSSCFKICIIISISFIVIIAAIIILYFFYLKKDKDNDQGDEPEDSLLRNYTFEAVYYTEENSTYIYFRDQYEILEMNIDGIKFYNTNLCILNNSGYHTVYILVDLKKLNSLGYFFLMEI